MEMERTTSFLLLHLQRSKCVALVAVVLLLFFTPAPSAEAFGSPDDKEVYIVYRGHHSGLKTAEEIREDHHSLLLSVKDSEEEARNSLVYSYKNSIDGFAALLSPDEAAKLSDMDEVVSTFPSQARRTHTTRSWTFLTGDEYFNGAGHEDTNGLLEEAGYGEDIIVGVLDTGIWPESKSFSDEGMKPIPKRWKGICQEGDSFNSSHCNRKLIGARYYLKGFVAGYGEFNPAFNYRSSRDHYGHGSHTSSIVGGRRVDRVSAAGGFALGSASGGAPRARIAMYKVCWQVPSNDTKLKTSCYDADILAAMDDAVGDGVDVFSMSIGKAGTQPAYNVDGMAIGALHLLKHNIVVVGSAGNEGPGPSTAENLAPWIITVAASSIDRKFDSPIVLGNGLKVKGRTITPEKLEPEFYFLVYAGDVSTPGTPKDITGGQCFPGSLNPAMVKGKIVLCLRGGNERVEKSMEVRRAGGVAIILGNLPEYGLDLPVDAFVIPGTAVFADDMNMIRKYIKSSKNPVAKIIPTTTVLDVKPAPFMGPNSLDPNILKPDITAPGLEILAAWSGSSSPSGVISDPRRVDYNIMSGTSVSCPHVAAVAALLRALHPEWSPAAIKSALITTATLTDNLGLPLADASGGVANPFNYGSGHLNPNSAADPGLVYDASYEDYLLFLCSSRTELDPSFKCPTSSPRPNELNYPSISISGLNGTVTVKRTVTNVGGNGTSTYIASVISPPGVSVKIQPQVLRFHSMGEKQSFIATFKASGHGGSTELGDGDYVFGSYTWSDGIHMVRSPIAVSLA